MIDHLLALDPGHRGIARFFVRGGAAAAARSLFRGRRALLTTGFTVALGQPETDGPPGTAALGRALRLLGQKVTYITDQVTVPSLEATLDALGEPPAVLVFEGADDASAAARRLLAAEAPTHLVSIERPGRTRDGDYRNARGKSVRQWNAPLDALFLAAPRRIVTVGIGDGGNEIGMGNVRARIGRASVLLRSISSVVKVQHLVVAGTSNWGAWGVVAELSRLAGRPLLHSAAEERRMVEACVAAGAVDGISRRREATVDGLPLEAHVGMLELLRLFGAPRRAGGSSR
jgi:D-glutamate cyclase-like protein